MTGGWQVNEHTRSDTARLAVLGDIHGNAAALRAVLADVTAHAITEGVCTGDIVLRGDDPEACVQLVAGLGWPTVAGNTDVKVAERPPRPVDHPSALRTGSRSWTRHRLSPASLDFLAARPLTAKVAFAGLRVLVVHGRPEDPTESLFTPETPTAELRELARTFRVDVLVAAHTHRPMAVRVDGCLFLNPGSVGESLSQDRRPAWAWIEAGPQGPLAHLERTARPLANVRLPRGMHP